MIISFPKMIIKKKEKEKCSNTHALTKHWGDSAFDLLTVPFVWLCLRMTRLIYLSAHVVFLIQTADHSQIAVTS